MKTAQLRWHADTGWEDIDAELAAEASLVLVFADTIYFREAACFDELRRRFPQASITGCSSSGSVLGTGIFDDNMVATVVRLDRGRVNLVATEVPAGGAEASARTLMAQLNAPDLQHVIALSEGLTVNGSALARGLNAGGEGRVVVTGGLAGDGTRFGETWVMADAPARKGCLALLGLYGDLRVQHGSFAGWQEFAGERLVTRSEANVVFEIDDQPALALYKRYLGDQAADLPGSGLRFPLSVRADKEEAPLIRTLLAIDKALYQAKSTGRNRVCVSGPLGRIQEQEGNRKGSDQRK